MLLCDAFGKQQNQTISSVIRITFDCRFKNVSGLVFQPGEVWQSDCKLCKCDNQTLTEECFQKPAEPTPVCGPNAELVNTSCCGDPICGKYWLLQIF